MKGSEHCRNRCPAVGHQPLALYNWFGLVQVHVSLSSREAEVEYLEDLSHRLVPLLLRRRVAASRLAAHLASSLLGKKLLLSLLDSLCDPR